MVKKNFIYLIISLFAISILFTGCSSGSNNDKLPTQQIKVVSDTNIVKDPGTNTVSTNVVDKSFNNDVTVTNSNVEIGSLI